MATLKVSKSATPTAVNPINTLFNYQSQLATMAVTAFGGFVLNVIKEHQSYIVQGYTCADIALVQTMAVSYSNRLTAYSVVLIPLDSV
ncbi:hypothetical protein [Psychrobacter sp. APC 3350]|uniref:hypothetical protein n=1 Tax=Psychrobacter sp. APC 3350 TaxID=3035195 RepID=UPI0025B2BED6|nr:hypothetical protein [Psychrobacter sp. APC 3350]MDN3453485.1 hypothetical protein [Psychrobacter sp. APC 3350]